MTEEERRAEYGRGETQAEHDQHLGLSHESIRFRERWATRSVCFQDGYQAEWDRWLD